MILVMFIPEYMKRPLGILIYIYCHDFGVELNPNNPYRVRNSDLNSCPIRYQNKRVSHTKVYI